MLNFIEHINMSNQEELFKLDPSLPIEDVVKLPEGTTDELQPFESFAPIPKSPKEIYDYYKETGYMPPNYFAPLDKPKAIMSIDPGSNGCIAVLNASGDVFSYKMPDTPKDLFDLFKTLKNEYSIEATLEKVGGMPGNGGSRMFNFGQGYGYIEMALIALEIKTTTVSSQAWQKTFLIGTKSKMSTTEWKNKLKGKAQQLYPSLRVTLGNADALLILEYAKNLRK